MTKIRRRHLLLSLSPWAILGSLAVLVPIAFFLATSNIRRDKENMTRLLVEKGAALIRSFEAGARAGRMGMDWGATQVQRLLVETAQQPDILYLVLTDQKGVAVAHSDLRRIGRKHQLSAGEVPLENPRQVRWHQVETQDGVPVFEVYKRFTPIGTTYLRRRMPHRGMMMSRPGLRPHPDKRSPGKSRGDQMDWFLSWWSLAERPDASAYYMFVGLDMAALESASVEAKRHALAMSAGVVLIGLAGMVSLFLAQGYKLARQRLAKVRAFSDQVVDNLPMGLVASDENGSVAAYNETAEDILGTPSHKAVGEAVDGIVPPELWQLTDQLNTKGTVIEEDLECQTGRSTFLPLRVSAAVLRGEDGSFLGYVFIFRDLTEVRRLQQEVERSRRLASLGSLAAGVAHEVRNPLSSIKGFATYFRERFGDDPKDRDTATTMIQEVERLDRVIGQLLEFARPSTLKIRPVPVADLIQHSLKLIEGDAHAAGIEVTSQVPSDLNNIPMDRDRMSQVLLNLYLNSIQAMNEGGTLEVKVAREAHTKRMKIMVADNGRGMDPAEQERVFDPYFTTKSDGTGLGLAIVHRIMEAHGGEIEVRSALGRGTTVTLILPGAREVQQYG